MPRPASTLNPLKLTSHFELPLRTQPPRHNMHHTATQSSHGSPHSRPAPLAPRRLLYQSPYRRSRQPGNGSDAEAHAHPRPHHVEPLRDGRDARADEGLVPAVDEAVRDCEGVHPRHVADGEPGEGYAGDSRGREGDDVEDAEAVGEDGDEDAGGEARAVDYCYEEGGVGLGEAYYLLSKGCDLPMGC